MKLKKIQSFVKRNGRISKRQQIALNDRLAKIGLSSDIKYDFTKIFGNNNEVVLDIGFGNGDELYRLSKAYPHFNFIGIEVYLSGINAVLKKIEDENLTNIRLINDDAVKIIHDCISEASVDRVQLFFPDPWPKKRHHKRRIIQKEFLDRISCILKDSGIFHIATDWEDYAEHIQDVFNQHPDYIQVLKEDSKGVFLDRKITKFEQKGIDKGHKIYDLIYRRS